MKGFVYIIRSKHTDDVYYGSTKKALKRRFSGHKSSYKTGKNDTQSFLIMKYADAYIELVEEVEYEDKKD